MLDRDMHGLQEQNVSLNAHVQTLNQELSRLQNEEEIQRESANRRLNKISGLKYKNENLINNVRLNTNQNFQSIHVPNTNSVKDYNNYMHHEDMQ